MGMDVYGRSGNYFRNNCWWWRPLSNYVSNQCKEVISQEDYDSGNYNDGHRVDYEKCEFIVEKLQKLVDDGSVKEYEKSYKKHLEELPLEDCEYCEGSGVRQWEEGDRNCNVCNTEHTRKEGIPIGKKKSFETSYPFSEENVIEFIEFVKESEGFEIC